MAHESMSAAAPGYEPGVVAAYRCYCVLLLFLYAVVAPMLIWAATAQESPFASMKGSLDASTYALIQAQHDNEVNSTRFLLIGLCAVFAVVMGVALTLKPTPGSWVYHIVILCLGLGGWTLPFVVIMLILWFKPETQAYFGRGPSAPESPLGGDPTVATVLPDP